MQKINEIFIQIVQACFAFKSNRQLFADDVFCNGSAALSFLSEQRIAKNHVRAPIAAANFLNFSNDVRRGSRSIRRGNPVWAVGAEFRTASARQHRKRSVSCRKRPSDHMTNSPT